MNRLYKGVSTPKLKEQKKSNTQKGDIMRPSPVILQMVCLISYVLMETHESPKAVATRLSNWADVFNGETITLRCDIYGGEHTEWMYSWYKNGEEITRMETNYVSSGSEFEIKWAQESHNGVYRCRGRRNGVSERTEISEGIIIKVLDVPKPVLRGPPQTWLTEGDSVTLSCEVKGSTKGWRFSWYKTSHSALTDISNGRRRAGGSYTFSPAHTGVYVCRAERGEPAYHTGFSQRHPLFVTSLSPPTSMVISPNKSQNFASESFYVGCEEPSATLRWFSSTLEQGICPSGWTKTGPTCRTSSASTSDSGIYWCQSGSGKQSNLVNITVHDGDVILESPAHPLTEGNSLTLRCRYRRQPSNISADFYKKGTLLYTSTTGEMIIPAISKSHEGLYRCRNPERGESPESWVTVKASPTYSESSVLVLVGVIVGLVIMFVIIILVLLYHFKKSKGLCVQATLSSQQQESQPAGSDGTQSEYMPLQRGTTDIYDTIKAEYMPLQHRTTNIYEALNK